MRKISGFLCIVVLTLGAVASLAAQDAVGLKSAKKGQTKPASSVKFVGVDHYSLSKFKAQNHLSAATNNLIKTSALKGPSIHNGTALNTIPYFQSWFITGTRNSVYPYSMVGQNPKAGGTTTINNELIPLITKLIDGDGVTVDYTFDPTIANDPQGSDVSLAKQSPIFDATTVYPGPPADFGQIIDTNQRAEFNNVRTSDWHTLLNAPTSPASPYTQTLFYNNADPINGDWLCFGGETPPCTTSFPVVNINTISTNFGNILAAENPPNSTIPIIITDFVTAYIPSSGGCCVIGFHTASAGTNPPGANSVLVWTWASWLPQSNDPFGPGFSDTTAMSQELSEIFDDPFVNTLVPAWVDGSVHFAQGNMENGDTIEAMNSVDSIYPVTLATTGGAYTYHPQNEALLAWFTRKPFNGGLYSWPNVNTLSLSPHPAGCNTPPPFPGGISPCWSYGEGSGAFFFGPPF